MWWHCRWATGSADSLWRDTTSLFREYYGSSEPGNEIVAYTEEVLALLEECGVKATFFVLGEMASYFPDLVRLVHDSGHEIACHGWSHVDADSLGVDNFYDEVRRAKELLENLTGENVLGYRAPNLVLTPWIFDVLSELGFDYDSSVCPSRKLLGKFGRFSHAPNNPFLIPLNNPKKNRRKYLVEIPIPAMPFLKIPACSGIMTRIMGRWWTETALFNAIRQGDVMYYFHPYEIGERPVIMRENNYIRIFMRNLGKNYKRKLRLILSKVVTRGTVLAREAAYKMMVN